MDATYKDIANDFELWSEYVDPQGLDTIRRFELMTESYKIAFLKRCFGPEGNNEND